MCQRQVSKMLGVGAGYYWKYHNAYFVFNNELLYTPHPRRCSSWGEGNTF